MASRARRPPSPLPRNTLPPRFPHRTPGYVDADEKKASAISGDLRKSYPSGGLRVTGGEWKLLILLVVVALGVRLFRLSQPNSVVFDEVHFGKFASKYIKTQYYVDVHPPLAKLLITLAAFMRGFNGEFDFKEIAKVYENTPYTSMRLLPATLGVAVIPLSYLTLRGLDCAWPTALLGSLFILFENGLITQSRHILLDSPLIFFTSLTIFCWVAFSNEDRDRKRAFTEKWWLWLILTGLSLGAVVSCKWVGLFTIATVGLSTLRQLWLLLGDLKISPRLFMKHFLARALCLIVLPIFFYMIMFAIHFQILQNSGDGDGFMSSAFQHTLGGKGMANTYADVAFGSEITIRHVNTQGGYLHSHDHPYPGGSHQQQITLYPHRDQNNNWRIVNATEEGVPDPDYSNSPLAHVTNGLVVRFEHVVTSKRLHSHDMRAPVSDVDFQNEVSGYGFPGFSGDANDNWAIEIEEGEKGDRESNKRLRSLRTKFRLRHILTGCYLFSHKVKLPEWGFEQQEVTCNKNAVKPNSLWYIETNTPPQQLPDAEMLNYKLPGFFAKFWELQQVMWTTNAGLTDRHTFDSRPHTWPTLRRGINFWVKDHRQIYLLGNPFIWWLSTLSVLVYAATRGFLVLREKRGYEDFNSSRVVKYDQMCGFLAIGWALHYFPFFLMQRQLFLHHYLPALYFAILLCCAVFDLVTTTLRPRLRITAVIILTLIAIYNYAHFSPLIYGNTWTKSQCENSKWLKTWDFSCNDFHDNYSQYHTPKGFVAPTTGAVPITASRVPTVADPLVDQAGSDADEHHLPTFGGAVIEPGHNVFQQDIPKEVKSSSPVSMLQPEDVRGYTSSAATETLINDAPPPLPREADDLITAEDEGPVGISESTSSADLVADTESTRSMSLTGTAKPQQEESMRGVAETTTESVTAESVTSENENELEKARQELFSEDKV